MKNGLSDLNNILFEQLERITDDTGDVNLEEEMKKTKVILGVAENIIDIADTQIRAMEVMYNIGLSVNEMPELIKPKDALSNKKKNLIGVSNAS